MQTELEKNDPGLLGKRIAITGAGRGLGRALAIVVADHGAETVLLGRNVAALNDVANTIRKRSDRKSLVVPCDLAKPDSIAAVCDMVLSDNPTVDVLINNGAPWLAGNLNALSDTDIISIVAAAVTGTILITKGLLPGLERSTAADIVTVVSTAGILGCNGRGSSVPFHAAKHGQSGFSDRLRHELKGRDIRVSAIYPPDFDDADPTDAGWHSVPIDGAKISSREIVSTVLFVIATPRTSSFPVIIMEGKTPESA